MTTEQALRQALEHCLNWLPEDCAAACEARAALVAPAQQDEVQRLRRLAATCYAGLGGECNLPEPWLDALLAASNGEPFSTDGLLPFEPADKDGALYRELLFAVGRKYSGETRHQTALRYIQQAEHSNAVAAIDAAMQKEQS